MEGGCLFVSEEMRICTDAKREFLGSSSGLVQLVQFPKNLLLGRNGISKSFRRL